MSFTLVRTAGSCSLLGIRRILIVGAGTMGRDIAYWVASALAEHRPGQPFAVTVFDISADQIRNASEELRARITKALDKKKMRESVAKQVAGSLAFRDNLDGLEEPDLVIEAVVEDLQIKRAVFADLRRRFPNAVLASNTSHYQPERIFEGITNPARTINVHFNWPAWRNMGVEIIPSDATSRKVVAELMGLFEGLGKVPAEVRSSFGFATNVIFEALCQLAVEQVADGSWTVDVDLRANYGTGCKAGPLFVLNGTGGNVITAKALDEYARELDVPWFKTPALLREKAEKREQWDLTPNHAMTNLLATPLIRPFTAVYLAMVDLLMQRGVISWEDLDEACECTLALDRPSAVIAKIGGPRKAVEIINWFRATLPTNRQLPEPRWLMWHANNANQMPKSRFVVTEGLEIHELCDSRIAVITLRNPAKLNATADWMQLLDALDRAERANVRAVVIRGYGPAAFCAGANVQRLHDALGKPEEIAAGCTLAKNVIRRIINFRVPVVAALKGFVFGGGAELALACHIRVAADTLVFGLPEYSLGIVPGAGGCEMAVRLVGPMRTKELALDQKRLRAGEAHDWGLVSAVVPAATLDAFALGIAVQAANGDLDIAPFNHGPVAGDLEQPEFGERIQGSAPVARILVSLINDARRLSFADALDAGTAAFVAACATEDARLGLATFVNTGKPPKPDSWVHR